MKRFLLFTLVLMLAFASIPTFAASDYVTIILDGEELVPKDALGNIVRPILVKGTTYLPVRAVAEALDLNIDWHDETKSVLINSSLTAPVKTDVVNVYINGEKIIPMDVNGNVVNPILKDGTTYLPVRAVAEAFGKMVSWEQETHTVLLSAFEYPDPEEGKTYAFLNKASGKAISLTGNGLETEAFYHYSHQGFTLTKADTENYWYITANNDKNFDVNGNSKNPGAKIITYNKGTADNQQFCLEKTEDGYLIYALSSLLPLEDSAGVVKQNAKRQSLVQKWDIVEFAPVEKADKARYFELSAATFTLTDEDSRQWILTPNTDGEYIITNIVTEKSLDVANNSKASGDPIITYKTSGDANQRWIFEKQTDGTYLIKSVHSELYLSVSDGNLIHAELNESFKQNWIVSVY